MVELNLPFQPFDRTAQCKQEEGSSGVICVFTSSPAALQHTKKLALNVTSPRASLPAKQGHRDDAYLIGQQRAQSMMQVLTKSRTNTLQKSEHLSLKMRTCQPTKHNCLDSEPFGFVPDQATLDGLFTLLRARSTRAESPLAETPVPR